MRRGKTVSLVSITSKSYWDQYGRRWLGTIEDLDPRPDEILLLSDFTPNVPSCVRLVEAREPFSVDGWMNHARVVASGDYIGYLGMDDTMPINAFSKLTLEGDVIVSGNVDGKGDVNMPTRREWLDCLNDPWYTLNGYQIVHRDIAKLIPYRPLPWADWVASLEYFQHKLDVRFENRIRYYYNLHDGQVSRPDDFNAELDKIALVKQMIRDGGIKPGACFPPEPL